MKIGKKGEKNFSKCLDKYCSLKNSSSLKISLSMHFILISSRLVYAIVNFFVLSINSSLFSHIFETLRQHFTASFGLHFFHLCFYYFETLPPSLVFFSSRFSRFHRSTLLGIVWLISCILCTTPSFPKYGANALFLSLTHTKPFTFSFAFDLHVDSRFQCNPYMNTFTQ